MALYLAEESLQKGKPFLMPQTERALMAHSILSRFLKAFINHVSDLSSFLSHQIMTVMILMITFIRIFFAISS